MQETRVILADTDRETRERLRAAFTAEPTMRTVAETDNGAELVELCRKHACDLVVMELVLAGMDGLEVLRELSALEPRPKTLVLTGFAGGSVSGLTAAAGADYLMLKPCREVAVVERARQMTHRGGSGAAATAESGRQEGRLASILQGLGILPNVKGYTYLKESILLAAGDRELLDGITKRLYPAVARRCKTTAPRVERAMRHAIGTAWERGDGASWRYYFGTNGGRRPTSSELIALLADRLSLQQSQGW